LMEELEAKIVEAVRPTKAETTEEEAAELA